jgi:2-hydroxy-3-keto-5-methylthiopentenyl-1-phosphate phosphatase
MPDYWAKYREQKMTHFQALQAIFASIHVDQQSVRKAIDQMEIDPGLPSALKALRAAGWNVVVGSAGCEWYIRILLGKLGIELPVWANPGSFVEGRGLLMELPRESPFFSQDLGISKAAIVEQGLSKGKRVAFAGDGYPDLEAARLVPDSLRFAKADLAEALTSEGLAFQRFEHWSEIADVLIKLGPETTEGEPPAATTTPTTTPPPAEPPPS